jgi:hypothetical protein
MNRVIAWHTPDERYTALADRLRDQLDSIGQAHHIYRVEPVGNWRANILATKARLVVEAMEEFPTEQLLFLDLDVDIRSRIAPLFRIMEGCDAAFSVRHKKDFGSKVAFSGRVYLFNQTEEARLLALRWKDACASGNSKKEEDAIARIVGCEAMPASLKIIPPAYAAYEVGTEPPNAVIVHRSEHARDHAWLKRAEQAARRQWRKWAKRDRFEKLGVPYYD